MTPPPVGGSVATTPRRAVVLVGNPASPYSRGLRVARSLAGIGFEVEIAAMAGPGLPAVEHDGDVVIRRYEARGPWVRWHGEPTGPPGVMRKVVFRAHRLVGRFVPWVARQPVPTFDLLRRLLFWPTAARGWWAGLRAELPPADLYHACGILSIPIGTTLARDARQQGRAGRLVYDVIDVTLESNNIEKIPRPFLAFHKWKERRWVRHSDAIVTVNDPIADHLVRIWRPRERPTVLLNCQPRWDRPEPRPDHIRAATGIPPERA
ncbi:MAG TPA: hypothetical protein VGQ89_07265, partial [Candidatus Limnocylindrales bacterium]|nr:hypothetical protein [Candidatus Limnocylindrales bacterium]